MTAAPRKQFATRRGTAFGPLAPIFDDLWWAWGTVRFGPGMVFPRNMVVVRDGPGLVAVHPVMLPDPLQAEVDGKGTITDVVRLGDFHGMDDSLYVERYRARRWSPAGATAVGTAPVDRELVAGGPCPLSDGTVHAFEVGRHPELVIHLRRHGGILLTCDSVQNWERRPPGCSTLGMLMARLIGFKGRACVGPGWRKASEPRTGTSFGPRFRALLDLEWKHLVSAHGPPILDDAKDALRAAVDRLYPR